MIVFGADIPITFVFLIFLALQIITGIELYILWRRR